MSAITEMPANTPSPIGSTESFWPGRMNAASVAEDCSAAAVAELELEGEAAADADGVATAGAAVAVPPEAGIEVVTVGADALGAFGVPVTLSEMEETPMTEAPSGADSTAGAIDEVAAEVAAAALVNVALVTTADVCATVEVDTAGDAVAWPVSADEIVDVPYVLLPSPPAFALALALAVPTLRVHDFSITTSAAPPGPEMGVRVIVHNSVIGPSIVCVVVLVCRVVGGPVASSAARGSTVRS